MSAEHHSNTTKHKNTLVQEWTLVIVEFDKRDIVRHPLVKHIVEAFDRSVEKDGTGDR